MHMIKVKDLKVSLARSTDARLAKEFATTESAIREIREKIKKEQPDNEAIIAWK